MTYYKIRHKETGLYRKGGVYDVWTKNGKTWDTLGKLRAFITNTLKYGRSVSDWEVVEYEVRENSVKDVYEVIDQKKLMSYIKNI